MLIKDYVIFSFIILSNTAFASDNPYHKIPPEDRLRVLDSINIINTARTNYINGANTTEHDNIVIQFNIIIKILEDHSISHLSQPHYTWLGQLQLHLQKNNQ